MMKIVFCIVICLTSIISEVRADEFLEKEIEAADKEFFDAFNTCNIEVMRDIFSKELEFYHDLTGESGYDKTMKTTLENCERNLGLNRKLVEGSQEVHALNDFGAIQKGQHVFCHPVDGKQDCGKFEFFHIWKKEDADWKLFRVISYGH